MRFISALKIRKYLGIAIVSALGIGVILPLVQTGFVSDNILAWYLTLIERPLNTVLYFAFSILFGVVIALQLYNRHICKTCNAKQKITKGSEVGAVGAAFGFLIGVCPACIGLIALFVPLSVSITLSNYNWVFMGIAVVAMIAAMHLLDGFKRE